MNEDSSSAGQGTPQKSNQPQEKSAIQIIGMILLVGGCLAIAYLLYQYRYLVFGAAPSGIRTAEYYTQMMMREYVHSNPGAAFKLYFSVCGFGYAGIAAVLGLILMQVEKK